MKILDLPHFNRFGENSLVKVLRHKDVRRDLWGLFNTGEFEDYQNTQSWDVFGKAQFN